MTPRPRWSLGWIACLSIASACSSAPPAPTVAVAGGPASTEPSRALVPGVVDDLATLIPIDAGFVVELPDAAKAAGLLPADQRAAIAFLLPMAESALANELELDKDIVADVVEAFDRATVFGDAKSVSVIGRFRTRGPVEQLLAKMERVGGESAPSRDVFRPKNAPSQRLIYYPAPRLLVWTTSTDTASRIEGVAGGRASPFSVHPRRLPDDPAALRLYADFAVLASGEAGVRGFLSRGSGLRATLGLVDGALRSRVELSVVGDRVPRLASLFEAAAPGLAPRLPEETLVFSSLSLKRKPDKTLRDVVKEIERATGESGSGERFDALLKTEVGFGLDDIGAALGGEITFGIAAVPNAHIALGEEPMKGLDQAMFFTLLSTRDDARAKKLLAQVGANIVKKASKSKDYRVTASGSAIRFAPVKAGEPAIRVEPHGGAIAIEVGAPTLMDRLGVALDRGGHTLGATAGYKSAAAIVAKPSHGLFWFDLDRTTRAFGKGLPSSSGRIGTASALLAPSDRGIDLTIDGENGAEAFVIGTGAAFAIYGVRRYLANAKVAEAKNTLGAIARSAVASYERELLGPKNTVVHRLCKSAAPVPSTVPKAGKYTPSAKQGVDFDTGSDDGGWRCLRFAMTMPHYYQYEYRQAGPYKGPARGGPDPGPDGFEASAEGDLDGNGKTSLFTRIGKIDRATNTVILSREIFVSDEFE